MNLGASFLESHYCFPVLACMLPPSATEPARSSPVHRLCCRSHPQLFQPEGRTPARIPGRLAAPPRWGWGGPRWANIPRIPLAPTPCSAESGGLTHSLVAQAVALPVSWDWGCGEAASNRSIRTGGPPAEPRRTGAGGGACEQSRKRAMVGVAEAWRRRGRLGVRYPAWLSQVGKGHSSPTAFCS